MWEIFRYICVLLLSCQAKGIKDRYYPHYHLAPECGWMNDPNGLSYFKNLYHLFYQYNPDSSHDPGTAHWAHATSKDLFNWKHEKIAMYPDQSYDRDGVFSGSALIEDDIMYLFYTGQVKFENGSHTNRQAATKSTDGLHFKKYEGNPIIQGDDFQPNFRDPKVWKINDTYYMVLGNSFNDDSDGRIVLFTSLDKITWNFSSVIDQSDGDFGYMWECPDLFELNGRWVLLFSPQGVEPQGDKYKNLYQTGYKLGSFDPNTYEFIIDADFVEIDKGTDFYATQTFLDPKGRRIMVAWFDMWERNYPEQDDGFNGMMTLPRTLTLSEEGKILQWPVKEIASVRGNVLRSGKGFSNDSIVLKDNAAEVTIEAQSSEDFVLILEAPNARMSFTYNSSDDTITLDRSGDDGIRRAKLIVENILKWLLYIDASSVELFSGEGELTMSSRFFPDGPIAIRIGEESEADEFIVTSMKRTLPKANSFKCLF